MATPVTAYLKIRDLQAQSMLLESSDSHAPQNNRSFIGIQPIARLEVGHGQVTQIFPDGTRHTAPLEDKPLDKVFKEFMQHFQIQGENKSCFGLYGYTSYNAIRYTDRIPIKDTTLAVNDAPDILYLIYKQMIVFDPNNKTVTLTEITSEGEKHSLEQLQQCLNQPQLRIYPFRTTGEITSTSTDEEHKARIRQGIKNCLRGDVFQLVLSRRFIQKFQGDDFQLYRALRSINPSPYLFYFDFGNFRIMGSSPETHCRVENQTAYIDPIAGTAPRNGCAEEDEKNAAFLRDNAKENAEHVMLVDLARNDLSRNCHEVSIDFYKEMQYFSHVIHLVSRVKGRINPDSSGIKTFMDTFPAGTLSGAPKVRAMQLISEYEPHNRGIYGGCIGFVGFDGSINQAITIRTFVSRNQELWFQAGSGIVAASDVDYELQEVNNKLAALRQAIQLAENI